MKKPIQYPRYFQGTEPEDKSCIIVFPAEGSMGTAYWTDLKLWSNSPCWTLAEMNVAPVDKEIVRWQAIALGVPSALPVFRAEPTTEEL